MAFLRGAQFHGEPFLFSGQDDRHSLLERNHAENAKFRKIVAGTLRVPSHPLDQFEFTWIA
jgi:hypothetical protein